MPGNIVPVQLHINKTLAGIFIFRFVCIQQLERNPQIHVDIFHIDSMCGLQKNILAIYSWCT